MCGGAIKKMFGGGTEMPEQTKVADPVQTVMSDVSEDTGKANDTKKEAKGKSGLASTIVTPLANSSEDTGKKKLGQ